jgi:hypothetical protein
MIYSDGPRKVGAKFLTEKEKNSFVNSFCRFCQRPVDGRKENKTEVVCQVEGYEMTVCEIRKLSRPSRGN